MIMSPRQSTLQSGCLSMVQNTQRIVGMSMMQSTQRIASLSMMQSMQQTENRKILKNTAVPLQELNRNPSCNRNCNRNLSSDRNHSHHLLPYPGWQGQTQLRSPAVTQVLPTQAVCQRHLLLLLPPQLLPPRCAGATPQVLVPPPLPKVRHCC